ncbi:MAG: hypothetical protein ACTHOR_12135 [Devosia sp.]|jgi:hypothetical protein|nr:hypothetical protein [Devosiaceae bacterium]
MSTPAPDEPKLTPEAAAIIARARKSFVFTIGLLIVGFIVIAGAVVYRATMTGPQPSPGAAGAAAYAAPAVKVPQGATIVSAVASGGEISVTYKNGAATSLRIFDGKTGAILREVPIVGE